MGYSRHVRQVSSYGLGALMKWGRWFFYFLAFADYAMAEYVRWGEHNRPEAGYWLASAIVNFLIGYIVFTASRPQHDGDKQ